MPRVQRLLSFTTIMAINFKESAFLGADSRVTLSPFGEVVSNNFDKIIRVSRGIFVLASGCSDVAEELRDVLPICFRIQKPTSYQEVLDRVVACVNFFTEYFRTDSKLILLCAFGDEPFKTGVIKRRKDVTGHVHQGYWVEYKVVTMGSGRMFARDDIDKHKKFLNKSISSQKFEEGGVKTVLDALKHASRKDWCTGGELHALVVKRLSEIEHVLTPKNPHICTSEYKKVKVFETSYDSPTASPKNKEANVEKRNGKRKIKEVAEEEKNGKRKIEESAEEKRKGKRKVEDVEEVNGHNMKKKKNGAQSGVM